MTRKARYSLEGRSGQAEWSFDGSYLGLVPDAGPPLSFSVPEFTGIAGDDYTIALTVAGAASGGKLVLSHLGADGPTLLDGLRRAWLPARAQVLRLSGSGEGRPFSGQVAGLEGRPPEPFRGLLFEEVLVVARDGFDLDPLFLALFGSVEHDESTYTVRVRQWPGEQVVFSKMAGQTDEFARWLQTNRAELAEESAAILAAGAPTLPLGPRGMLAGMWLPGRLMELEAMEAVCPGVIEAFRGAWLASLPRHDEGEHLLGWAAGGSTWVGCTRGSGGGAQDGATAGTAPGAGAEGHLWLLCGKNGVWFLEALSIEDRATYCFTGGEEVPALVSRLLCAPQFSREALYSPLAELTGESADLAIAAQALDFLVELRRRFKDRVIHQTTEGWKRDVGRLGDDARI